jgi:hypothetical protein
MPKESFLAIFGREDVYGVPKKEMDRSRGYDWLDIKSECIDSALSIRHGGLMIVTRYFHSRLTLPKA